MQPVLRFPKLRPLYLSLIFGFSFCISYGVKVPIETVGFFPVQGGADINENVNLYLMTFDETKALSSSNSTDVVLLDGIKYLAFEDNDEDIDEDNRYVYVTTYEGYNTAGGERQDEGRLVIETDQETNNLAAGGVVGFIRKAGAWNKTGEPVDNLMGSIKGTLEYETLEKSKDVVIDMTGSYKGKDYHITGESVAQIVSDLTVTLTSWSVDESHEDEFIFSSTILTREEGGNVYEGLFFRADKALDEDEEEDPIFDWKTKFGLMRLVDQHDTDGDGNPDITDTGADKPLGIIERNSIKLGGNQVFSKDLNTKVTVHPKELWLYGENLGWFYLPDQDDASKISLFIPDERLGWIWTNEKMSPYYIRESDGAQLFFDIIEGQVWYYDYDAESWFTPVY